MLTEARGLARKEKIIGMLSTEPKMKRSNSWTEHDEVDAQHRIRSQAVGAASVSGQRRVSPFKQQQWRAWVVILLSWIALFLVLALMFRATGCNRSSKAGTQSVNIVAESGGFEARSKNGPLQPVQQSSLSSQPVSSFGSKRRDPPVVTSYALPQRDS